MISYLGTVNSNISEMRNGNITNSLSTLNLQQNDVVFAVYVSVLPSLFGTISGWTLIQNIGATDRYNVGISVYVKIMGSTPDSSVTASPPVSSSYYQALSVIAFRGVDTSSLYDGTTSFTSGINTGKPTPPGITLSNSNSVALVFAANTPSNSGHYLSGTYGSYSVSYGQQSSSAKFSLAFAYQTFSTPQTITNGVWNTASGDNSDLCWVAGILGLKEAILTPTVTTQAVSSIDKTTATGNGNITVVGTTNPHLRGVAYMEASSGDISFIPLPNPSFEDATLGWAGAGTLARSSEQAKYGTYSMKVSWASGSEAYGEVHPTPATYSGKKITFGCWVWASVANIACLNIYDNAGAGYEAVQSAYHPGDSTWRFLTVTKTLRSGLTDLILRCRIATGSANSAYFDGALSPYSDSVSPTLAIDSGNYSTGAFTKALSNLILNTDYRAAAFAQNSVGIANGVTVGFKTLKADESNFLLFM